ncbi:hypothetical protein K9N68_01120 [Kovacikia minuta CCNUW1]|uniref:hypothetical protein n=1 Tax=Kovacikia minuta TaxID=2931930 RepID=UPI001CCD7682|nr:hypothetical protein [Kovacikia minuta]UBF26644.1 hypothetical protein K9N68_01120 [Kovacikia minuta CCNUW1]
MSNGDLENRMTEMERRQQRQDQVVAEVHEILLRVARQQEANAGQIARNSEDIAALRALIELQTGNGHGN